MVSLPAISVSVKAAVLREGTVLLLSYDDEAGFHYNLPGGKAREGESLRDAVRRKVLEETGLRVNPRRLLFVVEYVPDRWHGEFGDVQKVQFNFLADPLEDGEPRKSDPPDPFQVGFEWVPLGRLGSKRLFPRITAQLQEAIANESYDAFADRW